MVSRDVIGRAFAVLVAATLIAGCGGGDNDGPTQTPESTRSATRAASPSTSPTQEISPTTAPIVAETPAVQAPATQPPAPAPPTNTPVVAAPTPPAPPPPPPPPPAVISLTVAALNVRFVPNALSAPVGATVNVTLDNQDAAIDHDIVISTPSGGTAAQSAVITGPAQTTVTFAAEEAGSYRFKCSIHPQQMLGTITVS